MILAVLWTLICMIGIVVWGAVLADTVFYWLGFRKEDGELGRVYFQVLLAHATVFAALMFGTVIGALALLFPTDRGTAALLEVAGLFAGYLALTALGVWIFWSRRRTK